MEELKDISSFLQGIDHSSFRLFLRREGRRLSPQVPQLYSYTNHSLCEKYGKIDPKDLLKLQYQHGVKK